VQTWVQLCSREDVDECALLLPLRTCLVDVQMFEKVPPSFAGDLENIVSKYDTTSAPWKPPRETVLLSPVLGTSCLEGIKIDKLDLGVGRHDVTCIVPEICIVSRRLREGVGRNTAIQCSFRNFKACYLSLFSYAF
jgi:hypothetical protein